MFADKKKQQQKNSLVITNQVNTQPHHRLHGGHGAPENSCSTCIFSHIRHMYSGKNLD